MGGGWGWGRFHPLPHSCGRPYLAGVPLSSSPPSPARSNERIPLKAHMKMVFEIRDLKYATPATVSRVGILYISTDAGTQVRGRED